MVAFKTACRSRTVKVAASILALAVLASVASSEGQSAGPAGVNSKSHNSRRSRFFSRRPAGTVKLNCFNAAWPNVLERVARQTGSTLVMHDVPDGRLTRRDRNEYSRTEAVRILNQELQRQGFRLLEKDEYLVVLNLDATRSRYTRSIVQTDFDEQNDSGSNERSGNDGHRDVAVEVLETLNGPGAPSLHTVGADHNQTGRSSFRRAQMRPHQNRSAFKSAELRQPQTIEQGPAGPALTVGDENASRPTVVRTRRRGAVPIARLIYGALRSRAERVDAGPGGFPAFRVFAAADRHQSRTSNATLPAVESPQFDGELFSVGIDEQRDRLLVSAPRERRRHVAQLIRRLDAITGRARNNVRLVAAGDEEQRVASRLSPQLERLMAQRGPAPDSGNGGEPGNQEGSQNTDRDPRRPQDNQQQDQPQPQPQPQPPGPEELSTLIQGLKGDVSIEAMPELGVLILSGNDDDVEAVRKVIAEIVRLSAGATPDVHLLLLKHVNSEALAALLSGVYERLGTMRFPGTEQAQRVNFVPVVTPNAVLILAPPVDMKSILKLANELDRPVDPESEFQVIRLKNAIASQVVSLLEDFYEEPTGLRTRISAVADLRTNSVIVQAKPRDLAEVAALIHKIDRDSSGSVSRMRIIPLKNAPADELAFVINTAIRSVLNPQAATQAFPGAPGAGQFAAQAPTQPAGATQAAQQFQEAKSVVLEFLESDGETERTVRSGILADIRVTADRRVNSLVVTAPQQSMQLIEALIRRLDQPTSAVADIKVFPLKNGDAASLVEILQSLFEPAGQQDQTGVQVVGAEDAGSGLIPVRFSVDPRTNSIIAIGSPDVLIVVGAILFRLDESDIRQRRTEVIRLKNSPAEEIAQALNDFLTSQRELAEIDPELISNIELLEREIIAVAEPVTNSLLISATPRYFDEMLRIIEVLDEAPAQVIIQALLVEVELDNTDEFGVELGFQDSMLFNRSLVDNLTTLTQTVTSQNGVTQTNETILSAESTPGFLFNRTNLPLGNNTQINPSSVGTQGLSSFSLNRQNSDLGFGGLVLSASSESISILIRALAARRSVHILSRPQIRTLDNQAATILVGQQVPVVDGVTINLGIVSPDIIREDSGIILSVIPRITPDDEIVMQIIAEKSEFTGAGEVIFTDAATGNSIISPTKDITIAESMVSVPNGHTIVLGGMITKSDATLERKVPWLGDVPLLGKAFRFDSTTTRRTELLIFLTPRIIRNDADSELIKQIEAERLHFLEEEAENVHGPLYAVPPAMPDGPFDSMAPPDDERDESFVPPFPDPQLLPNGQGSALPTVDDDVPTTAMPGASIPIRRLSGDVAGKATLRKQRSDLPLLRTPHRSAKGDRKRGSIGSQPFLMLLDPSTN